MIQDKAVIDVDHQPSLYFSEVRNLFVKVDSNQINHLWLSCFGALAPLNIYISTAVRPASHLSFFLMVDIMKFQIIYLDKKFVNPTPEIVWY